MQKNHYNNCIISSQKSNVIEHLIRVPGSNEPVVDDIGLLRGNNVLA